MGPLDNIKWTTGEYDWFFRGIEQVIGTEYYNTTPLQTVYERIISFMPEERRKVISTSFRSLLTIAHREWQKNKDPLRWLNYTIYSRPKAEQRNQAGKYPPEVMAMPDYPTYPVAFMLPILAAQPKPSERQLELLMRSDPMGPPPPCDIKIGPARGQCFPSKPAAEVPPDTPPPALEWPKPELAKMELSERIGEMFDNARKTLLASLDSALAEHEEALARQRAAAPPIPAKIDEVQLEAMVASMVKARTLDEAAIRAIVRSEMNQILKEHRQSQRLPAALPRKPKAAPPPVIIDPPTVDPIPTQKKGPAQPAPKAKLVIKPPPASAPAAIQPKEHLEEAFKAKMAAPEILPEDIPSFFIFGLDTGSYETLAKTFPPNVKVEWAEKDNASTRARAKACDYALISRFAGHSMYKAMRRAMGNNRAYFIQGGGTAMLRYMADVSERHIKAALKRRADAEKK